MKDRREQSGEAGLEAGDHGWGSLHTLGLGAFALGLLIAFVTRQARTPNPLVSLRIFRSRNFSGANLIQMLMVAGLFGMFFLGVLHLQRVLGFGALETGLAFLPVAVLIGTLSLGFSARLTTRFGARAALLPGLTLMVAGLALFARAPVDGSYLCDVLPVMVLLGAGAGLSIPSLMTLAMSGRDPERLGPRLGPGQHEPPGRRRGRTGDPRHARHGTHQRAARRGRPPSLRADRRLPPRLSRRRRTRRRRTRCRRRHARPCRAATAAPQPRTP